MKTAQVHFGGPDRAPGALRDLLADRIAAVPRGGAIDWVTYYFRDRRLAADLIAAHHRGVDIRISVDGYPRTPRANDAVIALLKPELGAGLRVVRRATDATPCGKLVRPRLHEKLYCFSHPQPTAIVGSFNPSGDQPEMAPSIANEIGDHDRGHNLLVELRDPELVEALVDHARQIHTARHGPLDRFAAAANQRRVLGGISVYFWPRVCAHPIVKWFGGLKAGSRVRLAASHISGTTSRKAFIGMAARGVALEILTEATHRRVPPEMEQSLSAAGIPIRRICYEPWLPMHNKFALVESNAERSVVFGSLNWSRNSQRFNREIAFIARDPDLFDAFADRWDFLSKQATA